jgi:membrane fusion protein (multidrug efflux system)
VLQEYDSALTVPAVAIISELSGKKVFVARNGSVESLTVETGIRSDSTVQILSGIMAGDTVLTSSLQTARQGMPVTIEITQ